MRSKSLGATGLAVPPFCFGLVSVLGVTPRLVLEEVSAAFPYLVTNRSKGRQLPTLNPPTKDQGQYFRFSLLWTKSEMLDASAPHIYFRFESFAFLAYESVGVGFRQFADYIF